MAWGLSSDAREVEIQAERSFTSSAKAATCSRFQYTVSCVTVSCVTGSTLFGWPTSFRVHSRRPRPHLREGIPDARHGWPPSPHTGIGIVHFPERAPGHAWPRGRGLGASGAGGVHPHYPHRPGDAGGQLTGALRSDALPLSAVLPRACWFSNAEFAELRLRAYPDTKTLSDYTDLGPPSSYFSMFGFVETFGPIVPICRKSTISTVVGSPSFASKPQPTGCRPGSSEFSQGLLSR